MQIDYQCTGGFANLNLSLRIDTDRLASAVAAQIKTLIDQADVFNLTVGAPPAGVPGMADGLSYRLAVTDGDRHRTLEVGDAGLPTALRPLLQHLQQMAIEAKNTG